MNSEEEILSVDNTIQKRPVTKKDVSESIKEYLGEDNLKILKSISKEEYNLFKSFQTSPVQSYFVKGTSDKLKKFQAYFIALCSQKRYSYSTFMMMDYVSGLSERMDDLTFLMGADKELLFLYLHKESAGIGNTDNWLGTSALDKIANRNRKKLVTVVLSERDFYLLERSDELKKINLGGAITAQKIDEAANKVKEAASTDKSSIDPYS